MVLSRRLKVLATVVALAVLVVPAWYLISPLFIATVGEEERREGFTTLVATGVFVDGEPGHFSSGQALVLSNGASYILRLEEFSVTNGPGLHVYLAKESRVSDGDLDLGPLKASQGSSNYDIPLGTDPSEYDFVIVWCVPFSVQFGYATLTTV